MSLVVKASPLWRYPKNLPQAGPHQELTLDQLAAKLGINASANHSFELPVVAMAYIPINNQIINSSIPFRDIIARSFMSSLSDITHLRGTPQGFTIEDEEGMDDVDNGVQLWVSTNLKLQDTLENLFKINEQSDIDLNLSQYLRVVE